MNLSVCNNVLANARLLGKTSDDIKNAVMALLQAKKITDFEASYILNNI